MNETWSFLINFETRKQTSKLHSIKNRGNCRSSIPIIFITFSNESVCLPWVPDRLIFYQLYKQKSSQSCTYFYVSIKARIFPPRYEWRRLSWARKLNAIQKWLAKSKWNFGPYIRRLFFFSATDCIYNYIYMCVHVRKLITCLKWL